MADSASVKRGLIDLFKILDAPSYIAKFMDAFFDLPVEIQYGFIEWVSVECDMPQWRELAKDETLIPKAIRSIVFHYSGREELKQPSKDDLKKLIADYIRKKSVAEYTEISVKDADEFTEELEGL